jgi:plasmid stabilization system protein ParE
VADRPDQLVAVELTDSFLDRLDAIEAFLTEVEAHFAYDELLDELRGTVIPNLRRFPQLGRSYRDNPPQSTEALAQLAQLPQGSADTLREYLHGDYLILYTLTQSKVFLLSIRHHRQLSYDLARLRVRRPRNVEDGGT